MLSVNKELVKRLKSHGVSQEVVEIVNKELSSIIEENIKYHLPVRFDGLFNLKPTEIGPREIPDLNNPGKKIKVSGKKRYRITLSKTSQRSLGW